MLLAPACTLLTQPFPLSPPDTSQQNARLASIHALATEELGEREGLKGEPSRDHRAESAESLTRLRGSESRGEALLP